jgi:hypothetical protein
MTESRSGTSRMSPRLRFELIFVSACIAVGIFVLPAAIYGMGTVLLGPYGTDRSAGLGRFYIDFFGDLAEPSGRAWLIVLGPVMILALVRLLLARTRRIPDAAAPHPDATPPSDAARVEPKVTLD